MNQSGTTYIPPNAGHMTLVYEAVCPMLVEWARELRGTEPGGGWFLCGAGMVLPSSDELTGEGMGLRAGLHPGGKAINQDACGWSYGAGRGGRFVRAMAVADGVSGSLYSEFGALLVILAALQSGLRWGAEDGNEGVECFFLEALADCRERMARVADRIPRVLKAMIDHPSAGADARGVEEARRQLDVLDQPGAEPLCSTVVALVDSGTSLTGVVIGDGCMFTAGTAGTKVLWWPNHSERLAMHVGPDSAPAKTTFTFADTWAHAGASQLGIATDGVGGFDHFRRVHERHPPGGGARALLEAVAADMRQRGVPSDLMDNMAVALMASRGMEPARKGGV